MKISQGDILEFKDGKKRKVLGVCGEVYLMSTFSDFDKVSSSNSTYKDLLDFDLIVKEEKKERKWKHEIGKEYWFISSIGPNSSRWNDDEIDNGRRNFLGVYPDEESAQKACNVAMKAIKNL